jgi:hypothetical protein
VTTTRAMGRPKMPQDVADLQALQRIAALAAHVLQALRQPGRGMYPSETVLRQWLAENVSFTTKDLGPALMLLEVTGRIVRPAPNGKSQPGRLASGADIWHEMELTPEVAQKHRVAELAGAIVTSFQIHKPGLEEFGTGGLYEMEALQADLHADGIGYDEDDLAEALRLLEEGAVSELDHRIVWRTVYIKVTQRAARVMVLTHRRLY